MVLYQLYISMDFFTLHAHADRFISWLLFFFGAMSAPCSAYGFLAPRRANPDLTWFILSAHLKPEVSASSEGQATHGFLRNPYLRL